MKPNPPQHRPVMFPRSQADTAFPARPITPRPVDIHAAAPDTHDQAPSPQSVKDISPEGKPADSDRLSRRAIHEWMLLPVVLGGVIAVIVGLIAGLTAGIAAFVFGVAMGALFNPVFWASAARAEERETASRNEHEHERDQTGDDTKLTNDAEDTNAANYPYVGNDFVEVDDLDAAAGDRPLPL